MRRDFLRKFALQPEIDYVIETIADEVIMNDDSHYFAYPNTKNLRNILKKEEGKKITITEDDIIYTFVKSKDPKLFVLDNSAYKGDSINEI